MAGIGNIYEKVNGIIMHSIYVVLPSGLPLGILDCNIYTRETPIERMAGRKNIHNMHLPIEKK